MLTMTTIFRAQLLPVKRDSTPAWHSRSSSATSCSEDGVLRREIRQAGSCPLAMFESIGSQIGQFMERKRAEEALREADRRKDEFLAMLGHELRNPLGVISTVVQLLNIKEAPDPEVQDLQNTIKLEVSQLARLLDDLLISRV